MTCTAEVNGKCCGCGYAGPEETPCSARDDGTHCVHWWDGPDEQAALRPLLVGESNPYGSNPDYALYPEPPGCAGHRLCHKVLGLTADDYLERFERVNLCSRRWNMREARARADELCNGDHEVFVLFGAKVTSAFLPGPWKPFRIEQRCAGTFIVLPHPSGLSRGWNEPGSFERARELLAEAGVDLGPRQPAGGSA